MKHLGVYNGRFSPIHKGHESVIETMYQRHGADCLIIIGSSNTACDEDKHFFTYEQRRSYIRLLFNGTTNAYIPSVPNADYPEDMTWLGAIKDILTVAGGSLETATFYGGCAADLTHFREAGLACTTVNREACGTSGTQVRKMLRYWAEQVRQDITNVELYNSIDAQLAKVINREIVGWVKADYLSLYTQRMMHNPDF